MGNENEKEIKEKTIEEPVEVYKGLHDLIYNCVGLLFYTLMGIMFFAGGFFIVTSKDTETLGKLLAIIFVIAGLFLLYKSVIFVKDIFKNLSHLKKSKRKILTLRNIGYFVYSLVFVVVILMVVSSAINPNSSLASFLVKNIYTIIVILGISGTVLIYVDLAISSSKREDGVVVLDIKKKNK